MSLSRSSHTVQIIGHLGRDPELRHTPNGQPVCNFSLASSRTWRDAEGGEHKETIWWRVAAWGKLAEVCQQYLAKGRQVLVEGQLRADENGNPRVFQRQDGTYGAAYELTAQEVRFLNPRDGNGSGPGLPTSEGGTDEDRIPF